MVLQHMVPELFFGSF